MPKNKPAHSKAATTTDIELFIQALNKMTERPWGDGRDTEAKALFNALYWLNLASDRTKTGVSHRALTLDQENGTILTCRGL
ncbi:hypothetical protein [Pseudomonas sp. BC42]|uniref:hypothetical protein n=1 Tax=Pseudomonas sp. BC42 TaxID=2933816 RepID=UPI001F44FFFD|nr:hypothetical protein [Pseudomonas sp. BC42]ULT73001.1 hypothetical protein L1O02_11745 [Pseudomonas sp. BC42]